MQIVIIGNGVAGFTAANKLRENNSAVKISIYTDECHIYYPRPRLYDILSGKFMPQEIYAFSEQRYRKRNITIHLNQKVLRIEPDQKELLLDDHSYVSYDQLLLANGAHPFVPPIKGAEKSGVFTLRSMKDALTIHNSAKKTKKVIVIGGGLLGLESAASLMKLSQQVTVVELFPRLLPRQLDQDGAKILKDRIESLGIDIKIDKKTEEILGKNAVSGILLSNGEKLSGKLVLISAGIRPNMELAMKAGIKANKGIIVDPHLKTNFNNVYACGNVAEFEGRVYETIPAAIEQAEIAAMNMLEKKGYTYRGTMPSHTLKVVGIDLTSIGIVNPMNSQYQEVKKIDEKRGIYKKIVLKDNKIVGVIMLGDVKGITTIRKLMAQKKNVARYQGQLLEDSFDYRDL